jgi:hypothetical protein
MRNQLLFGSVFGLHRTRNKYPYSVFTGTNLKEFLKQYQYGILSIVMLDGIIGTLPI